MSIPMGITMGLCVIGAALASARAALSWGGRERGHRRAGLEVGSCKTIGTRQVQEDEFGVEETPEGLMAVLADGMGRGFGGKIAAGAAVGTFRELLQDRDAFYNPQHYFRKAFQGASRETLDRLDGKPGGASVAAILLKDRKLYYATVGNVKVAVYRNKELVPVTSGHTVGTLASQKYTEGKLTRQEAATLLGDRRVYNFVGQEGPLEIECFDVPIALKGGEYVLLMTDGLYEGVPWKMVEDCLGQDGGCQEKALGLVEMVNNSPEEDKDNAAVVILRIR